jgi:rRNA maturation endonuclease Nob1
MNSATQSGVADKRLRPIRYGLPCAGCRLYYEAELNACPICNCETRVEAVLAGSQVANGSF